MQRGDYPFDCRFEVNSTGNRWGAVAQVNDNTNGSRVITEEEAEANARLIAAAPELLAALGRAKDMMCNEGENDLEEWKVVLHQVEATILKAGGEL